MTPAQTRALQRHIEALTDRVASARVVARAIVEGQEAKRQLQMSNKLPNLSGLAGAIDKLTGAIETDAQKRIERVEGLHAKRERVMAKCDLKLDQRDAFLDEADAAFDKLDEALGDNGRSEAPYLGRLIAAVF